MIGEFIQEHMRLVLFIFCVLCTIIGFMGTEKALEFCTKNNDIEGYFIYADKEGNYRTTMSSGFGKYLRK